MQFRSNYLTFRISESTVLPSDYPNWRSTILNRHSPDPLRVAFARRLVTLRRYRGWTQIELAGRIGCAPHRIARYEQAVHFPPLGVLVGLRHALRVSLDFLLAGIVRGRTAEDPVLTRLAILDDLPPEDRAEILTVLDLVLARRFLTEAGARPGEAEASSPRKEPGDALQPD